MNDYRFQALAKSLDQEPSSTLDLKESGTLIAGFLDDKAEEKAQEYLDLLEQLYERIDAGEMGQEKVTETLGVLAHMFLDEAVQLQQICASRGGLEDVSAAWTEQTKTLCRAFDMALDYFSDQDPTHLEDSLALIEETFEARAGLYCRIPQP